MTTPQSDAPVPEALGPANPILSEAELQRWSVSAPRPTPKANTRLVFVDSKGHVLAPPRPMTLSEVVWGGLRRVYEVDMREHRARFHAQVPCREKGFSFDVHFELSWRVHDPARVVKDGRTEVGPVYRSYLVERVSELSERYGLEERLAAERALKQALAEVSTLPEGIQLRNCALTLSLGVEAEAHFKSRTIAAFDSETRQLEHRATIDRTGLDKTELEARDEVDTLKGELRSQHQRRQLETQRELDALKHLLETQEAEHQVILEQHRLEIEQERNKSELQVKTARMEFYAKALASGNGAASLLPIFLDEHPEDVGRLLELLLAQQRDEMENTRKVLEAMLQAGVANGRDLDEPKRLALQNLLRGLSTGVLGAPVESPRPPAIEHEPSDARVDGPDDDTEDGDDDDPVG